jgi:hypothetical protein
MNAFHVRVNGRLFRITPVPEPHNDWTLVDCRDARTTFESQAMLDGTTATPESILADSQVRDAIRSAYYNATSHESGLYPVGGDHLPEDFAITLIS